jgi:hypothetical protein
MSGGGSKPGERRGGRQKGTKNRKTVEREIIETEVLRGKIEAGIAAPPPMGKVTLEKLLAIALTRMDGAMAGGKKTYDAFLIWFDRSFHVPEYRAVAGLFLDIRYCQGAQAPNARGGRLLGRSSFEPFQEVRRLVEGKHSANFLDGQYGAAARIQFVPGDGDEGAFAEAVQGRAQTCGRQGRSLDDRHA